MPLFQMKMSLEANAEEIAAAPVSIMPEAFALRQFCNWIANFR
jgi:hypothetical protein